jgi:hypothetical protein
MAVAGFAAVFISGSLAYALGLRPSTPTVWAAWGLAPPGDRLLLLAYVGLNPWIEEWFWRGTLLGGAGGAPRGAARARWLAILGFVPFHLVFLVPSFGWPLSIIIGVAIAAASWIWVILRERQGHVWGAAASHWGADAGLVALYEWVLRGAVGSG